jgi:hypothetical protein
MPNPQTTTTTTTQETGNSHGDWEIMCWKNQTLRQQLTYTVGGLYRVFEIRASLRIHGMGIGVLWERENRRGECEMMLVQVRVCRCNGRRLEYDPNKKWPFGNNGSFLPSFLSFRHSLQSATKRCLLRSCQQLGR